MYKTDIQTLVSCLESTFLAASTDTTRPNLCGVLVTASGKRLSFAATDGHRLHEATPFTSSTEQERKFTVFLPSESVSVAIASLKASYKAYKKSQGGVIVATDFDPETKNLCFVGDYVGNVAVVKALPAGHFDFPSIERVVPNFEQLSKAASFIGISFDYLGQIAKAAKLVGSESVVICTQGPLDPIAFRCGDTFRGVVMPMRIGNAYDKTDANDLASKMFFACQLDRRDKDKKVDKTELNDQTVAEHVTC